MRKRGTTRLLALLCFAASGSFMQLAAADEMPSPAMSGSLLQLAQNNQPQRQRTPAPVSPIPETQQWAIAVGGLYTHRQGETSGWAPNIEVNYSPTDRLLLHVMAPLAFDRLNHGATHFGLGDVELGARYRFIDEEPQGWRPNVAAFPLLDLPTGNESRNLGTGHTHAFLPLWLSKSFGDWIPYVGGGYWINPGPPNKNWIYAVAGVQRNLSAALTLTGEIFHATSSKVGIKDQTGFDVGGRYNINANHHLLLSVGSGIENRMTTNQITTYFAYLLTF
jgi:hypothetical protein